MKVLILSDSHRNKEVLTRLKNKHKECDYFIHCGDSELYSDDPSLKEYKVVRGNNDYDINLPLEITTTIDGLNFYITHGHLNNVYFGIDRLYYKAKEINADVVCFGHTHILFNEVIDGVLFLNPGSISRPRNVNTKTYIIFDTTSKKADILALKNL